MAVDYAAVGLAASNIKGLESPQRTHKKRREIPPFPVEPQISW